MTRIIKSKDGWAISRRSFLTAAAGALAAPAVLPASRAWAAGEFAGQTIRVLTWPGAIGDAITKNVFKSFEASTGAKIIADLSGATSEMVAKVKASAASPQYDLVMLSGVGASDLAAQGLLDKPDVANIPNLATGPEQFRLSSQGYALGFAGGVGGLLYSSERVPTEPKSWKVLWDDNYKGRVWLPPGQWTEALCLVYLATKIAGGTFEQADKGFDLLKQLQPSVLMLGENTPQVADLYRSGSLDLGGPISSLYFPNQLNESNYKMKLGFNLEEGIFYDPWVMVIPKGHPGSTKIVTALTDFALGATPQAGMAADLGVAPFNAKVEITQEQMDKLGMVSPKLLAEKGINLNTPEFGAVRADWIRRFTEIFG